MKISHRIPIYSSLVIILSFLILSSINYYFIEKTLYKKIENQTNETTIAMGAQITRWLNGKLSVINLMADVIERDFTLATVQNVMNSPMLRDEFILIFGGLEINGSPISNTPTWSPPSGWDARTRPWYSLAQQHDRAILTTPYIDSATNDILISAVATIKDNGAIQGAFGGDLSLKSVSDAVNTLNFNNTGHAFLVTSTGEIISHPNSNYNGKNLDSIFDQGLPSLTPQLQELSSNKTLVLASFQPLKGLYGNDWLIGVVLDKGKALKDLNTLNIYALVGAIISALISSFILFLILEHIILKPVTELTNTATEISKGKLDVNITSLDRSDEIGSLAKSIKLLSTSLQITLNKIRKDRH
ncbi:cache domain-containing protein [Neptunomonas sp.]|uniref:HAMP domain-containing protein n=1 Tax=Neptunomonas sp. TaxID=1971898 RepID=UPI0025DF76BB|nr:cache domain-containing protein [Neptunomonas sp.]